jgi:ABC-2 type transport system permease protein
VFGMMVNSLFQFAIEVSQARERPWGAYTRTLPSGAGSRLLSYLLSSGVLSAVSVIPLVVLAALTTEATLSVPRLLTQHCSSPHHSHPVHAHPASPSAT